jgi:CDP-6-deoxy-D-xylo-4-hexulose-3-dehydrase
VESETIENRFNVAVDGVPYDAKFVFEAMGYNLEPNEACAAFGLVQLAKLQTNIRLRAEALKKHIEFFKQYEDWFILPKQLPNSHTGWLALALTIKDDAPFTRTELQIFLEKRNIQTRTVFSGNLLRQPGYVTIPRREAPGGYPHTDLVMRGGILMACHHGLTQDLIDHMHTSFQAFVKSKVAAHA